MAVVTQIIPNYLGGVSKQIDQKKLPGQVRECLNALPDPTFGLMKRPGFKWLSNISPTITPTDAKWFYINRDDQEDYVGCITPGSHGTINVWNSKTGVESYVSDSLYKLEIQTNTNTGTITKTNIDLTTQTGSGSGMKANILTTVIDGVNTYNVYVSTKGYGTGYADNDLLKLTAANTGLTSDIVVKLTKPASHYLQDFTTNNDKPHINYDVLSVQDTSLITNKTCIVSEQPEPTFTAGKKATVRLLQVKYSTKYEVAVTVGGTTTTATHTTINAESSASAGSTVENANTADSILTALESGLSGVTGLTIHKLAGSLELSHADAIVVVSSDNIGNAAITHFSEQVNSIADLPKESKHDRVVKVTNSGNSSDSYWVKFNAEDSDIGSGSWEESIDPNVSPGLVASTLPHELWSPGPGFFIIREAVWEDRKVGDNKSNEPPSFVNHTLQQAFFHNNRLGFLTEDNVSMSKSGEFYNFYHTTALTVANDDPVDVNCSSIRPAVLHAVLPTAQGLILFSQNQQFILFADAKILTPASTIIRGISNYEMDVHIDPVDVGTTITFVSKTPSYTRVFSAQTRGYEESPIINDIGKVVSEWIPKEVNNLLASPQNQMIALYGPTSNDVYLHKMHTAGQNVVMQAWFKWKLPGNVHHLAIDSDIMTAVVDHEGIYSLISCSLTQTPEEGIIVNSSGNNINPHMDMYASPTSQAKVTLVNGDTRIELPYKDVSTLTPVLLIGGSGTTNFSGVTESGFTITPTRPTGQDHTTVNPYFTVPNKDLTGTDYEKILIGYKYNFDVELPKTYFKLTPDGSQLDYTAALTIARMKFTVGLSSVLAFKVKSKGYNGDLWEGTVADAKSGTSGKAYEVPFLLKEENGIKVTLDGARQASTAYTVTSTDTISTVTFTTAPTGETTVANKVTPAQKIAITTDTWYDVQPVMDAGQYLADDVPLTEENLYTIPIHQRTENFNVRVFSNSPFPVALNSLMWEGNYSPRFYRRA